MYKVKNKKGKRRSWIIKKREKKGKEKNVDNKQKIKICNLEKDKGDRKKTIHEK